MDKNIKGIVIDPGHGGEDFGAIGNGIYEKDYNLRISKYMYDRFKELGIPVTLTRDADINLTPSERANKVLSAYGNSPDVIVISNHLNAGGGDGAEVIYALRNDDTLAQIILDKLGQTGQNIRRSYQRKSAVNPNKDYYFMHRNTGDTESVIVEYGFIDSSKDDPLQIKQNWQQYAEAVVQGVLDYIGYEYEITPELSYYTVVAGDSLYSIANKYGMTVNELKELNNLTTNLLSIGQKLKIKYSEGTDLVNFYEVKKGDTLYGIALMNNVSVNDLMSYNDLTSSYLQIGQVLKIPNNTGIYIVEVGDTLYGIAKSNNMTVEELKKINNLDSNILYVGQNLIIKK